MNTAYYGFQVKGQTAKFLEQFKDFYWTDPLKNIGFLGVQINSIESTEKNINFPKLLETYLLIAKAKKEPNLPFEKILFSYLNSERQPIILKVLDSKIIFFKHWKEFEQFNINNQKNFYIGAFKI